MVLMYCFFPAVSCPSPVPDTGQTKCYNTENEISCPQPGEDFYGQDASYTTNPISYTKLDADGNDLPDNAPLWFMVRDNVTGLIWEAKEEKDGVLNYANPHDADNDDYTWYDSNPETNGGEPGYYPNDGKNTENFINAINAASYCGWNDWRVPSANELETIINYSVTPGPKISTAFFPGTDRFTSYWSSTTFVHDNDNAFEIFLQNGSCGYTGKGVFKSAIAVHGENPVGVNPLVNGDGTVTDLTTTLMWQQSTAPGLYEWKDALAYCENLTLAGYNDWRLPTVRELRSLTDLNQYAPSINTAIFPDTSSTIGYWSSNTYEEYEAFHLAWYMDFSEGTYNYGLKTKSGNVRAVRGGYYQPVPGDFDKDGAVTLRDVQIVCMVLSGIETESIAVDMSADIGLNHRIDLMDLIYVLQFCAQIR